MAGKHDKPSAGKNSEGVRGGKPARNQVTVKTSSGTTLWKQTASLFSRKSRSKKG